MRRLIYLFFAFALLLACSKTDPDNPNPETPSQQETVTLSPGTDTAPVIATTGGSTNVSFTASSSWTASIINTKADSWCSVAPTSGGPGSANITITVKENTTPDNRSASVVIKVGTATQTIKVEQKQKDALTVTASSFEVSAEGGQIKVATKSNVSFTHTISTSAQKWIQVVKTKALKDSTLIFDIAANDKVANRSGQIYVASGNLKDTVNVYQAGEALTIVVSKDEYVLKSEGESFDVEVASNVNATMSMVYPEGVEAWITENTTKAISTNKFYFTAQANETYDSRSALLIFANAENNLADTVTVTQAQKDAIVLAKSEYEIDKEGGNLDFDIQTNIDIAVSIPESCSSWITHVETRAMETKQLHFNIASCDTLTVDRIGYIVISGGDVKQTIKVTQSNIKEILLAERDALIAFYKAAGGDNWTNNTNWCSDKPVSEWYGIRTDEMGRVKAVSFESNNLSGNIPIEAIINLHELETLELTRNGLNGQIPASFNILKKLVYLNLYDNKLTGGIPAELGELPLLKRLILSYNELSGEIPKEICNLQNLEELNLGGNQLTGSIPEEIGNLSQLKLLSLGQNALSGSLPSNIGNLKQLRDLSIHENQITGEIPASIGGLTDLTGLYLQKNNLIGGIPKELGNLTKLEWMSLDNNNLTGNIPSELGNLKNIVADRCGSFDVSFNNLSGELPASIMNLPNWNIGGWISILRQKSKNFNKDGIKITMPPFTAKTMGGDLISNDIFSKNEYTIFYSFMPYSQCPYSPLFTPTVVNLYEKYKDRGLGILSPLSAAGIYEYKTIIDDENITWPVIFYEDLWSNVEEQIWWPYTCESPIACVFNKNGELIFHSAIFDEYDTLPAFIENLLGDDELYESTDYSADGDVVKLQNSIIGNGIDIVLMGDGYSDRLIADGTYDAVMSSAVEALFAVEPYKSFRNMFNVYSVKVVSKNEVFTESKNTAIQGYFGEGTEVGGNDATVFNYTEKAVGSEKLGNALIMVMMNSDRYAGTCYMYQPSSGDCGHGVSVSYFPVGSNKASLERVLHHEACGHGFAKLGDEYAYEDYGQIPSDEIESHKALEPYGWWKNVDFTNDPAQVKWAKFLTDTRYQNEGLGVFEGGLTYWTGVWRPTDNSIMGNDTGGFNAPSREAIYYRIHKLAYGEEWEYNYEEFVEWDAINRSTAAQTKSMPLVLDPQKDFVPLHPPVVIPHSWKEAK